MLALRAYVESGSGSLLVSLVGLAVLVFTVAVAVAAKRATERRGHNGWLFFFLVLLFFPVGVIATVVVVLAGRDRTDAT